MRADLGGRGLGGLVAREIAMRRAVVDVISVVGGDNSAARAGNRIMGTQYHCGATPNFLTRLQCVTGAFHRM